MAHAVDDHFWNCQDIVQGILRAAIASAIRGRKNENGRIGAKDVKKTERAQIDAPIAVDGGRQRNGSGSHGKLKRALQVRDGEILRFEMYHRCVFRLDKGSDLPRDALFSGKNHLPLLTTFPETGISDHGGLATFKT